MTLCDRILERDSRGGAGETVIIARALIDPQMIRVARGLRCSPACAWLLSHLEQHGEGARAAFLPSVRIALRFEASVDRTKVALARQTLSLAESAASVSAEDLAACGSALAVVDLLRDVYDVAPRMKTAA